MVMQIVVPQGGLGPQVGQRFLRRATAAVSSTRAGAPSVVRFAVGELHRAGVEAQTIRPESTPTVSGK